MTMARGLVEATIDSILDNNTRISLEGDSLLDASVNIEQIPNDIPDRKSALQRTPCARLMTYGRSKSVPHWK
jgi:hypothetical protein